VSANNSAMNVYISLLGTNLEFKILVVKTLIANLDINLKIIL